ncbi:MAG: PilZ domain-containing protein [Cellvibrionaceae bacterium]
MSISADNRRRYNRVKFRGHAELLQEDKTWEVDILDISLKGALLVLLNESQPEDSSPTVLNLMLDGDIQITMEGHVAHHKEHYLGFSCDNIDLVSIQHLRRLIELNLGDAELIERDLESLVAHED